MTKDALIEELAKAFVRRRYPHMADTPLWESYVAEFEVFWPLIVAFVAAWIETRQSACIMPEALRMWRSDMMLLPQKDGET